jgi:hypothetical protein
MAGDFPGNRPAQAVFAFHSLAVTIMRAACVEQDGGVRL